MKKSEITHYVVMIVALALSSYLAQKLLPEEMAIAKTRKSLTKAPMGGFNKFSSDVQWMLFINYCGRQKSVTKENADIIYSKLNNILKNDPDFEKAYAIGGMMLSVRAPLKAYDILKRGAENPHLAKNSKLPFLAGFILEHNVKDADKADRLQEAERMFKMAIKRSGSPEYHLYSALLRTRAQLMLQGDKTWREGIVLVNKKHAYLAACFDEWDRSRTADGTLGAKGAVMVEGAVMSGDTGAKLTKRMLKTCQELRKANPDEQNVAKTIALVMNKVLGSSNLCTHCLAPYNAGDKFCSQCGTQVDPYGICVKCGAVLHGPFCSKCGVKNEGK
ncbi:MAG: hypothetical protein GXP32_09235 [Kiritimatiellaeota bacterium]|nr:hypothetical protein [Kiritimatiellota bacterium]